MAQDFKNTYEKRKAQGLCVRCGGAKATRGVHCINCAIENGKRNRAIQKPEGAKEPKYNCYWYKALGRECGVLNCLKCTISKCSFYETEAEYKERQKNYNNNIGHQIQIIDDLAFINGWDAKAVSAKKSRLFSLDSEERKKYIDNLVKNRE